MIKHIEVMSKQKMEEFMNAENKANSIVISIRAHDSSKLNIPINGKSKIKEVAYFMFDDVTDGYDFAITKEQASDIASFVLKHNNSRKDLNLIVHCDAGKSRSAGVAGAIMKYLFYDDTLIFGDKQYYPNMTCYMRVLNAFFK